MQQATTARKPVAVCTCALILISLSTAHGNPQYVLTRIANGGWMAGYGINDIGQVVGEVDTGGSGEAQAYLYSSGRTTLLGTLGGNFSIANALNNSGEVVGIATRSDGSADAFRYSGGAMLGLGLTQGGVEVGAEAEDINEVGQIVGRISTSSGLGHAFTRNGDGTMVNLGPWESASAINNAGQVAGSIGRRAAIYSGGVTTSLGPLLGNVNSTATDINNRGQVVGSFESAVGRRGFMYSAGQMIDIGSGYPLAVNDAGQAVGLSSSREEAVTFIGGHARDLRNFVVDTDGLISLGTAHGINALGQIVGSGRDFRNNAQAYILTPTSLFKPPPVPDDRPADRFPGVPQPVPSQKKGLIFITHGWNRSGEASIGWIDSLKQSIKSQLANLGRSGEWEVIAYHWESAADTGSLAPGVAASRAAEGGRTRIYEDLSKGGYDRLHFIGHSAGSWLIDGAADGLKNLLGEGISIQTTFLDAYVAGYKPSALGDSSDFAEHYLNKGDTFLTQTELPNAHNVDVTKLNPTPGKEESSTSGHQWPRIWYADTAASPATPSAHEYGFALSLAYSGQLPSRSVYPSGITVTLPGTTAAESLSRANASTEPNFGTTLNLPSIPQMTSTTGSVWMPDEETAKLATDSSGWITYLVTLDGPTNLLKLDYEFASDAEGFLTMYLDDHLVFEADERFAPDTLNTELLWLGEGFAPGLYSLAIRLDAYGGAESVLSVSNIQFSYIPEPTTMIVLGLVPILALSRQGRIRARRIAG